MKFLDNPFGKGSYEDCKTLVNLQEVAAVAVAADALRIKYDLVNGCCHNIWLEARTRSQEKIILAHARTLSLMDPRIRAKVEMLEYAFIVEYGFSPFR